MLFILDSRLSLLRVIQNNRPACVASRQTTDAFWSRRLPACRIVLRRRSPPPPLSLLPLGHSGWVCLAAGGFVVGWQHSSFFYDLFWKCMRRKQENRRQRKKLQLNAAPSGGVTGRGTHTDTHTLIHWLRRRHMLDNKTIQLKGSGRGWNSVQRCAGKWKQQWEIGGGSKLRWQVG